MNKEELGSHFQQVRQQTEALCQPLVTEDYVIQSIADVSPPKWHLAHTTWFFETFILARLLEGYKQVDSSFCYLFNSYYQGIGNPFPREKRGLLSRPTVETVVHYRKQVNEAILSLLEKTQEDKLEELASLLTLGLHHEQQHQELLLMDIKHNFSINPDFPCYKKDKEEKKQETAAQLSFIETPGGLVETGYPESLFCFDNELPLHKNFLRPFLMASRLVTNGEYLAFINEGGYKDPQWWLSDGWDCVSRYQWQAPLYWHNIDNEWSVFTLKGLKQLDYNEPVSHLSYYEADAYARWCGARLPTEIEWEHFVRFHNLSKENANLLGRGLFHPCEAQCKENSKPQQFFGDLWEWTASPYIAYPGYKPLSGKLGEYNGKFMANQMVLRGGSCATPNSHIRTSYRNFFQPDKRWQFSGIRLAKTC
jgi:ergothioneine biosynthesis protein EgtB